MFSIFKKKRTPPSVPVSLPAPKPPGVPISGFPLHSPAAFQAYYDILTVEQAGKVAEIYKGLITPDSDHPVAVEIMKQPGNAFAISNLLLEHVGIENKNKRGGIVTYLSFIAGDVFELNRRLEAGITQNKWMYVVCDCPNHEKFDGKKYDIKSGLPTKGSFIRPHGELGCKCIAQAVVEF